ncbi:MAG: hypothetical protein GY696_03460 [Gammaproteobacteria bacterium]|nr:hypothetical protein [Gammaproteobacteria bacterium]
MERNLADRKNEEDRVEKSEGRNEIVRLHSEYLQGLESQLGEFDVLIEEIQEIVDAEKAKLLRDEAKVLRDELLQREADERKRVREENRAQKHAEDSVFGMLLCPILLPYSSPPCPRLLLLRELHLTQVPTWRRLPWICRLRTM